MRWAFPPFCCLCWTISRMVLTDSCLAESMKEQVLMTMISASSAWGVSSPPAWWRRPIMTSESTRFLGQPRETKPILGPVAAGAAGVGLSRMAGGVTESYSSNFVRKLSDLLAGGGGSPVFPVLEEMRRCENARSRCGGAALPRMDRAGVCEGEDGFKKAVPAA